MTQPERRYAFNVQMGGEGAVAAGAFLLAGVVSIWTIARRSPEHRVQIAAHLVIDIAAITLMMHASGGIGSGLGNLLIISIGAASLVLGARTALMTLTRGEAILSHVFEKWEPDQGSIPRRTSGVLVSDRPGDTVPYAIFNLLDRDDSDIEYYYASRLAGETRLDTFLST